MPFAANILCLIILFVYYPSRTFGYFPLDVNEICCLQEKIMRVPYGANKEYFKYSLFLVFCNRIATSAVSAGALLVSCYNLLIEIFFGSISEFLSFSWRSEPVFHTPHFRMLQTVKCLWEYKKNLLSKGITSNLQYLLNLQFSYSYLFF